MDLGIKGRVALITGAGQGVGRGIALLFAQEGVKVAINDYVAERAEATVEMVKKAGGEAIAVPADVTDGDAVNGIVKDVEQKLGPIDILVNNAGIAYGALEEGVYAHQTAGGGPVFFETQREFWDKTMGVITYGTLNCARAVIDGMMERRWGRIVNIVSDAGRYGLQGLTAYSMGKAGVIGFTKSLSQDVGEFCVTANCVSPGYVETETSKPYGERMKEVLVGVQPIARGLDRVAVPEDIANAVAFLASERAWFITGQVMSVNGGQATVD
jgi:2-hydroxycyclohexanecarboxyl-CoA dehydrogenase